MKKTLLFTSLLCMLLIATTAQARNNNGYLERIRIEGRVESIRGQIAYVEDDCGVTFRVHLGPAWYWDERNYFLSSGSWVSIVAWQDPYDDYCYAGEIRGRDFCYDLCDSYGYPRWRERDNCYSGWRPTRSFFEICFVIGGPAWHCGNHDRYHHCDHRCDNGRRRWYSDDRHHGGGRGHDYDDDRGHTREGRRHVSENNDRGSNPPAGGGGNYYQVEKPRDNSGGGSKPGGKIQVEKPRDNSNRDSKSSGSYQVTKPRDNGGSKPNVSKPNNSSNSRVSKPSRSNNVTKPSRTEKSSSNKTWARK